MKLSDVNSYSKAEIRGLSTLLLEKLILKARDYYDKGKSPISDAKYDQLEDELRARDPKNSLLAKVGAKAKGRKKVKLPHPMYSLSKIKPENGKQFDAWVKAYPGPYVVSDKEDGLSIQIHYKNGMPHAAYTRGDGTVGQDVSHLLPVLRIPKKIGTASTVVIRAEIAMTEVAFQKYASSEYANARNLVAGLANRLNSDASMLKHAHVLAYEIIEPRMAPSKAFKALTKMGFDTPPYRVVKSGELSLALLAEIFTKARKRSAHAIDGLVIESDTVNRRPPAGTHSPNYAFAFKMQDADDVATVKIKRIDWEESKHGKLVPVIIIPPTPLAGVTVTNVTGHNAFFIAHGYRAKDAKKGIFKKRPLGKGAIIKVVRSGDVIPHVVEVVKGVDKPDFPKVAYKWDASRVNIVMEGTTDLVRDKRITSFFSTVGVDGIKLGVVQQLSSAGMDSIVKILRAKVDDLLKIPGFKQRKAEKLVAAIKAATREVELPVLMDASGYFGAGFGTKRSTLIVNAYPDLLTKWEKLTPSQITAKVVAIHGFQTKTAEQFGKNFHRFLKWLRVSKIKPILPRKVKVTSSKLAGQSVCFTGVRDKDLEQRIIKNGGTIASGVNKNTTILIAAPGKTSSKLSKAEQLNIPVYTIDSFIKKYKV